MISANNKKVTFISNYQSVSKLHIKNKIVTEDFGRMSQTEMNLNIFNISFLKVAKTIKIIDDLGEDWLSV